MRFTNDRTIALTEINALFELAANYPLNPSDIQKVLAVIQEKLADVINKLESDQK